MTKQYAVTRVIDVPPFPQGSRLMAGLNGRA
jgi:hypothetical protein